MRLFFLLLILSSAGLIPVSAQGTVWVALVKADNTVPTEDERLGKLQPRLKTVFGFDAYHLLHEARVPSGEKYAQWVLPRRDFYLKLEPLAGAGVRFEIYRDKTLLVDGKFYPTAEKPIFIAGPDYQDGRLIFLLQRSH
jgi:hypothetical protein